MSLFDAQLFEASCNFEQWDRNRPHRHQPTAICFLTMRLNDSIPESVLRQWHRERIEFLRINGVTVERDWKSGYEELSAEKQFQFDKQFSRQRELALDACRGACELANPNAADVVSQSLMRFHGDRYWMGDFVIMPNHVHCLVAFSTNVIARKQPGGWMRYSARQINKMTNRVGVLWHSEPFDHLVRNDNQLVYLRNYIKDNPKKAKLNSGSYLYRESEGSF